MKHESVAFRAKRMGLPTIMILAMVIAGLSVIPAAPGVVAQDDVGGEYGGDFRVGIKERPNTFNPLVEANEPAVQMAELLYDSLGRVDPYSLTLEPWVAKGWAVDPDNQSAVTVTLRDDVKWHDSTQVTIEDVDYTFGQEGYDITYLDDTILNSANNSITFLLDGPNSLFFSDMLLMKLIPSGFTATSAENGCGPFFLNTTKTVANSSWTLDAFDDYFNGRPYVDSLIYKYYSEGFYDVITGTGAGYDLLNGTLEFIGWDLTTNETFSTTINIKGKETTIANPDEKNVTVNNEPGMSYRYLGMNNDEDHVLSDSDVRRAITYCLDKGSLAAYDISGGLIVADSIVSPKIKPWFNDSIAKYDLDLSMANSILDQAGYMDWYSTGFRQTPDHTNFSFDLLIPTQDEDISAPAMGDNLETWIESIGINVTLVPLDEASRMQNIIDNNFDMYLATETRGTINPGFLELLFHSENIATDDNLANFRGRAREMNGTVSVNYTDITNTTLLGQLNHTNLFDDGTADLTAYKNGELWGVTEQQAVWTSDGTLPMTVPLYNDTIDTGSRIYRNRSVTDEEFWSVTLNDVNDEPLLNVPVTQVVDEAMVTVETSLDRKDVLVNSSTTTVVNDEAVTVNPGPDDLGNSPVETGTLVMRKVGEVQETTPFLGTGVQNVLIVDGDTNNNNHGTVAYYNTALTNIGATVTIWDQTVISPLATDMAPYNIVIWVSDKDGFGTSFDPSNEAQVATYLAGGGNFLLSHIFWTDATDAGSYSYSAGDFAYDYMGLTSVMGWSGDEFSVNGTVADPIYGGFGPATQDWTQGNWGFAPWSSDDITGVAPGAVMGIWNDDGVGTVAPGGAYYDSGTFKTSFWGFPFETIPSAGGFADDLMDRTCDFFVPPSAGCVAQLGNGSIGNQTISDINLFNQSSGAYLVEGVDYTLDYTTGALSSPVNLAASTIIAFYNYTTEMFEGTDYVTLNAWHYQNGQVNLTIEVDPIADTVLANYTWYLAVTGGTLFIDALMEIIDNYTFSLDGVEWSNTNYVLDNVTGIVTFNAQLGPGETVTVNYTCFNPTYYNKTFNWPLVHGGGATEDIATTDFHLKKNALDMAGSAFSLDAVGGSVDILAGGVLTYGDVLTCDYWFYDPALIPGAPVFNLANQNVTDNPALSHAFVQVVNAITGTTTNYSIGGCSADLINGTVTLPGVNPGDQITANYQYYNPAEIVYSHDLVNDNVQPYTIEVFITGALLSQSSYTINLATGHIDINQAIITLGPHDNLTANYYFHADLAGGDYDLDVVDGLLTLESGVIAGDMILADYTYTTYEMENEELGLIEIITNFDFANDTLTVSFDYRKMDELVEMANRGMDYETQAKYFKEAQGFLAEEMPVVPLFFYKVANAYNNSRYEGWDSTVGGIINFHSFIHLRNQILGDMIVSLSSRFDYVTEGEDLDLEIRVEDLDGNTIPEAILHFDGSGTYGDSTFEYQDENGNEAFDPEETGSYIVTYNAPPTTVSRSITITATATRPSYVKGSGDFQVTVHPEVMEFDIEIMRGLNGTAVTSIDSGGETDIRVIVTDKDTGDAIQGAMVSLSVSPLGLGGYLDDVSGTTDTDGYVTTVFGAINVTVDTTFQISVTVSKEGYLDGTAVTSISVDKDPTIKAASKGFLGLPAPPFLVIIMLLAGMAVVYAGYRKKR